MQEESDREALHRVADRLRTEFADRRATDLPGADPAPHAKGVTAEALDAEDEALVARLREALASIAATLGAGAERSPPPVTETALDGAEFVIRRALADDDAGHVLALMPSFVFLVALSVADRDLALELSERTAEMVAGEAR